MASTEASSGTSREQPFRFDADGMRRLLAELDETLESQAAGSKVRLVVAGGAAMMTTMDDRLSSDIDVISEGLTPAIRAAAARIAERHPGLRADWINDAAKLHRVAAEIEPRTLFDGSCLTVVAADDRYLLVMKLVSGRPDDEADSEHLIRELGIVDEDDLYDLIAAAVPERLQQPRMLYFASERLRAAWRHRRRQRRRAAKRSRYAPAGPTESGDADLRPPTKQPPALPHPEP